MAASAPPVRLEPPEPDEDSRAVPVPGGCLLCGVDAVTLPAAPVAVLGGREEAQREVWRPLSALPSSLGGIGPDRLGGSVCPPCADALNWVRSVGPSALERALIEYLRFRPRGRRGPVEAAKHRGPRRVGDGLPRATPGRASLARESGVVGPHCRVEAGLLGRVSVGLLLAVLPVRAQ